MLSGRSAPYIERLGGIMTHGERGDIMETNPTGMCHVCGKPGSIHLTEIHDGKKTNRSFCLEHAPAEMRDKMPFGPHRTPAEEVAFLRQQLTVIGQKVAD